MLSGSHPRQREEKSSPRKTAPAVIAVGEAGAIPMGLAPPFRDLSKRYAIETLEEALAEGIVVGHPAMPQFTFEAREINALLTYISGLKSREPAGQKQ